MIIAAIPVRNQLRWTAPLVESLLLGDQVDQVWVYDNGSTDSTAEWVHHRRVTDRRLYYYPAEGLRLYDMWNSMIVRASRLNARLAILNNDIRLPFMALKTINDNMDGYQIACIDRERSSFDGIQGPNPITANWSDKTGWAFMLDAPFWQDQEYAIHPDLLIWWADVEKDRETFARLWP